VDGSCAEDSKERAAAAAGPRMILRRLAACALACSLLIAGCTKAGNRSASSAGPNPWTIPGEIRIGNADEPDNLNPMFAHSSADEEVQGLIYATLLVYDDNGNVFPDLATEVPSYENGGISKDGKTIVVHMRKGLRWSDGAPLTADDWMFTYRQVLNPQNNTQGLYGWDDIASADAPDDHTIVIHLKKPNATILGLLAVGGSAYPPLPEHALKGLPNLNRAFINTHPISSGPFVLERWNHGSSLIFKANPLYYRGRPKLNEVDWKIIPNYNTLFNELQTHDVDVYVGVNENDISRLNQVSGIRVITKLTAEYRHLSFNMRNPILADRRVRLAIAEGIDWKRINDTIYHAYNQLAVSDIFPLAWAAPNIPPYPYSPQDARALLAQAGWTLGPDRLLHKGNRTLRLSISTGTNKQENIEAEIQIQSMLRRYGIDLSIRNYDVALLFAQDGPIYSGNYDMEFTIEINDPDPDNSGLWDGAYMPPHGSDTSFLNDPIVNRTSEEALLTFDHAKRKALYQQEEERIHELVPAVFFYWDNEYTALNSDVKNFRPSSYVQDTWNAWQWQT
jgi:peptide/nickel transport system substrate-binding protein